VPAKAPYEISTQSFSLPTTLLEEAKAYARLTGTTASGLVKDALEAHLVNVRLDVDGERIMRTAPGGARRPLADIFTIMVPWFQTLEKGDPYQMGRIEITLGRSMTRQMTAELERAIQRAIVAAWVAEERRLEAEQNGKARAASA
jgi:hypothetical protein